MHTDQLLITNFTSLALAVFFFFQAEDGIRDLTVTGVQTCALPICARLGLCRAQARASHLADRARQRPFGARRREARRSDRRAGRDSARPRERLGASAMSTLEQAYAEVERVTRRRAKNFAYGIMVLPRAKRRALAAVYAFAREVDDIADGELPRDEKRARLLALDELRGDDPMFVALADARRRFAIPDQALRDLVEGGLQDLEQTRYADIDELLDYCRKVAGAVGRACIPIYGSSDTEHAEALGLALQLINIMRDVREDAMLGRVYLPQDELTHFDVSEDDIFAGRVTPEWRALMAFNAQRARAFLANGMKLLDS